MSAKTTFAFTISITFAQATNVQAGIIISSCGLNLSDNKIAISPFVHELVKIAYFFLMLGEKNLNVLHARLVFESFLKLKIY